MQRGIVTSGRRRLHLLLAAAVCTAVAVPAVVQAEDSSTAGDLLAVALDVVHRDGDFVVFTPEGAQPVDAKAGAAGTIGGTAHDGFATYGDATLLDHYDVRIVDSAGADQLRPFVADAVNGAVTAGGQSLRLLPGTVRDSPTGKGQIDIVVSSRSPCFGSWLGCGGPTIHRGKVQSGQIWINPRAFDRPTHELANTVRHELGHTLGLAHYEHVHQDRVQTMHPTSFDAPTYEAGDTAGLRFVAGTPSPTGSAVPPAPADPVGLVESARAGPFGIVVHGWAFDPDTSEPVTVTVTIGDHRFDLLADEHHTGASGGALGHGFHLIRAAAAGTHEVCATARNVGAGVDTPLGCHAVVVSPSSVGQVGLQTF